MWFVWAPLAWSLTSPPSKGARRVWVWARERPRMIAAVGVGGVVATSEPARRAARFQAGIALILAQYAACYAVRGSMAETHEATSRQIEDLVGVLGGAYVKAGQLVSTAFPEVLPEAWVRRLETLVDDAPPRPWRETCRVIEAELGQPVDAVFEAFDLRPHAAASVGQVHRAVYGGRPVAVKIMYPGVDRLMMTDLGNIRRVVRVVKPALLPAVDEFRERVRGEFDYAREARRMDHVAAYLANQKRIVVPRSVLATKRVLVMDWLDGVSLRDALRADYERAVRRPALWRAWALYRLRARGRKALALVARANADMIFMDGHFSADPHPGNVLCLNHPKGALGLIDYGNFKTFDDIERRRIAALYVALAASDRPAIVAAMADLGFKSRRMDPDFIVAFATQCFDRNIVDCSPYKFLQSLETQDKLLTIPKGYMLVARVSLLLRGLGRRLGYDLSCAQLWRDQAIRVASEARC